MTTLFDTGRIDQPPERADDTDRQIILPAEFLPCIDDWQSYRVMSDWCEEAGSLYTARLLRWVANDTEWGYGLRRHQCQVGEHVWARWGLGRTPGWTPCVIYSVTATEIHVEPHNRRSWSVKPELSHRAWWDLTPRGRERSKPQVRKCPYWHTTMAKLARALCGAAI